MCKILLIREHHVNVLPERIYLNSITEGFQSQIQKVRVTKLTHSPWNCPITALGVQGRQELPLPSRVSLARPVLSSKCLLCRLPMQIHITCIACDVTGLDVATCGVANATSFHSVATKFSHLVANLAPKIGDFLLWENVH